MGIRVQGSHILTKSLTKMRKNGPGLEKLNVRDGCPKEKLEPEKLNLNLSLPHKNVP